MLSYGKSEKQLYDELHGKAEEESVKALFGSEIILRNSSYNFELKAREIISKSQGGIKIKPFPLENGEGAGAICLRFNADISDDYIEKKKPKKIKGIATVTEGDMGNARERAIKDAKKDALYNFNIKLKDFNENDVLGLISEVSCSKKEPGDKYYHVEIDGIVHPLEVEFFLDSQATSTQEHREQPAANHQVNRQERGRERFNCADIEFKMTMGEMFSQLTPEEDNFYKQNCQKNTIKRRKK